MGQVDKPAPSVTPFNSALETGIRALIVLEAFQPERFDLLMMTWLDHLVVHTEDFDADQAPRSLHPDLPNRAAELVVRRPLVEKGLQLMVQLHLVDVVEDELGISFRASDEAPIYLDLLQAPYSLELKERAEWMASRFHDTTPAEMRTMMEDRFGRWTADFRVERSAAGARP